MDLSVVLTSAAVSAVVSGLFTLISQLFERRARRRELLLKTATDLAIKHLEQALQLAKTRGGQIPPLGMLTYDYHHQFILVMKHGRLPPEVQEEYDAWLQQTGKP